MARAGAAPLSRGALCLAALCLAGCEAFYAIGPYGCDAEHLCTSPERPRCELSTGRCLPPEVLGAGEDTPVCADHGACQSGVCDELGVLPAGPGRCAPRGAVAQVGSGEELTAALQRYQVVRLRPGRYEGDWVFALRGVVLVADRPPGPRDLGAALLPLGPGPVVRVGTRGRLLLDGVSVTGGKGAAGHGVVCESPDGRLALRRSWVHRNEGRGVWARCPLQIGQSRIGAWDLAGNAGGGVVAEDALSLTNSFVTFNGTTFSEHGGVAVLGGQATVRALAHLTLVGNNSAGDGEALRCGEPGVTLYRSLVVQHGVDRALLAGPCRLGPIATDRADVLPAGSVKITAGEGAGFRALFDLHLGPLSPARDKVPGDDVGPNLPLDYDGDPRPLGAGYDFGADEYVP